MKPQTNKQAGQKVQLCLDLVFFLEKVGGWWMSGEWSETRRRRKKKKMKNSPLFTCTGTCFPKQS
jgi:hypothetical protein